MAVLSDEELLKMKEIVVASEKEAEDLDLTAYLADIIGITGVHVEEGWYNQEINETHITFYYMEDKDADFCDDSNENEEYYIQVDLWSMEDVYKLKKKVKKLLKKAGFNYIVGNDQFESEKGLYHKSMRFYYLLKVEGDNE
ncbi:MAG: hypothetical protein ACERKZ_03265 [Lachnotalea sp.]